MTIDTTAPDGALCTLHPDRPAQHVCSRCGNFMCEVCGANGGFCPSCEPWVGSRELPFSRSEHDFNGLLTFAYEAWRRDAVLLSLAAMIVAVVGSLGSFGSNVAIELGATLLKTNLPAAVAVMGVGFVVGIGLSMVLQGVTQMGMIRMCFDALYGRKADLSRLFSQLKHLGAFIVQWLIIFAVAMLALMAIAVLVGGTALALGLTHESSLDDNPELAVALVVAALALVPLMLGVAIWAGPVIFAPMELVYAGGSGWDSLTRAFVIGQGHRFEIFGYLLFGTALLLAAFVVGFMALCVGLVVTIPVAQALIHVLMSAKFLALRQGCDGMPPMAVE